MLWNSGDVTDDGEVQLNLPREEDMERNLPGEDVRDLPGVTTSGASVINQEERYRLEPRMGSTKVDQAGSAASGY